MWLILLRLMKFDIHNDITAIDHFHCHTVKQISRKPFINKALLQVLGLWVFPNHRYLVKHFAEICRAQYGNAMLVHIKCAPIWPPKNSVTIWKLQWLSRQMTICT